MDINFFLKIVTLILSMSVAAEKLVEIIKGLCASLRTENQDPVAEAKRQSKLHFLTLAGGCLTAWLASPVIAGAFNQNDRLATAFTGVFLGICASGGSSFWNSILTYLLKVKDIKEAESVSRRSQAAVDKATSDKKVAQLEATPQASVPLPTVITPGFLHPDIH